ncbi:MAG TPA: CsoR family transcriptional regulator [Ruminococcaceae bacterium]|nr:CsoR family transcriptional regulator [Oscillospiraceae bacterium]
MNTGNKENRCENCGQAIRTTEREQKLKSALIARLNRAEGQIRGIKGMIEKDAYCDDVLNQIFAVQSALGSISSLVLENHIKGCLVKKIKSGEDEIVDELLATIKKML